MTEPRTVYAISSGAYSDYGVWCIFETLDDAKAYLLKQDGAISLELGQWVAHKPDEKPYYDNARIEEFQFWPTGVVPHADA